MHICASQDYDSILFGARRLVRNITISGKRKVPNRNTYIDVPLEIFHLEDILNQTKLTNEQLVDVGILIGTDYNIGGIPGIGPKTALKLIQKYSKLENIDQLQEPLSNVPYEEIRELFLRPKVANVTNDIKFEPVDYDKVVEFLCTEKTFHQIVLIQPYKRPKIQTKIRTNHWKNGSNSYSNSCIIIFHEHFTNFLKIIIPFSSFLFSFLYQIFQLHIDSDPQISSLS